MIKTVHILPLIFVRFSDKLILKSLERSFSVTVRPYSKDDWKDVRFVCLNSDGPCRSSGRAVNFTLTVYCDCYIEGEPQNCFVATDDSDRAIGYVLCAADFDAYRERFVDKYYPRIKRWEFKRRKSALRAIESQGKYKNDYPAHLHIDLLPSYQHMGLGTKLMDTLCNHLKQNGVKGVMFTVWHKNYGAIKFYEKYGFKLIETKDTTLVYGLKL